MKVKFAVLGGQNAGKTSILRRYFHGKFLADGRMPTVGADVYCTITKTRPPPDASNKEANAAENEGGKKQSTTLTSDSNNAGGSRPQKISLQVWDTPGRERFVNPSGKTRYTASFSDSFLTDLDAVCLVYDVSSSTSFTHVLNWYYELIERIRRMKANNERLRPLPIIIVGNKIDIFQDRDTRQKELLNRKKEIVKQRNVLGLAEKWRGRDYRYEYSANAPGLTSTPIKQSSAKRSNNKLDDKSKVGEKEKRLELLTYLGTNTNYLEAILNNEVYRGSYLDSLLSSEDNSHPDKDMVQLWCMRNGLIHMDVSAKSGAGIDDLIHQLINIALKQVEENDGMTAEMNKKLNELYCTTLKRNDELDLHQRYGPKSRSCFPNSCCK